MLSYLGALDTSLSDLVYAGRSGDTRNCDANKERGDTILQRCTQ